MTEDEEAGEMELQRKFPAMALTRSRSHAPLSPPPGGAENRHEAFHNSF